MNIPIICHILIMEVMLVILTNIAVKGAMSVNKLICFYFIALILHHIKLIFDNGYVCIIFNLNIMF